MKKMRSKEKLAVRAEKKYEEYDWKNLFVTGDIEKLLVDDLNKYLDHHGIDKKHKLKKEKLEIVKTHRRTTW